MPVSSLIVSGVTRLPVQKVAAACLLEAYDPVVIEEPLEIRLQYGPATARQHQSLSVTMRTPGHDEELALGFLYTEGILLDATATTTSSPATNGDGPAATGATITVSLPESVNPDLTKSERHSYTSSSCGVCGKTSLEALRIPTAVNQPTDSLSIPAGLLYDLPALLREGQDLFDATGGLHAAGLFNQQGRLIAIREDIGRHNALDKIIGHALQENWLPLSDTILLLSGRACFELIQKAATAGIRIVAAVGPPSSLAVQLAVETGITLVGFLRQQRFNIYSGAHRIRV
jgi:FdhD protein